MKKYFVFDAYNGDIQRFDTEEERNKAFASLLEEYSYDGWGEGVEQIIAGEVTHETKQVDFVSIEDVKLDDDGCDEEGRSWSDGYESKCDYKLIPLEAK